jgi:tetratricopeptide (TPR) repeat protein
MGLFEDLNSGNISLEDDVIMQESFDDVFMEYTTVDKIPYFKTLSKQVILPIGVPMGKGNICFLYSKSIKESMEIMTSKVNMLNNKKYRLYYYPLIYKERINNRRYFFHDANSRSYNYEEIHNNTDIIPYERISVSNSESRNIFIDLSRYINLFESNTEKLAVYRTIPMYWEFFNHVLAENYLSTNSNYYNRFMVIDISNYRLGKVLKENLKNPLFMVYYSLLRFYSVIKTIDIDMYFYNGRKVLRVNPSQANEKTYALLRTEMKKLMSGNSKAMVSFDGLEEEVINNDERVDKPLNKVMSLVDDNKPEEIKDNPNDYQSLILAGNEFRVKGNSEDAIPYYKKVLNNFKDKCSENELAGVYYALGQSYMNTNQAVEAFEAYSMGIAVNKFYRDNYYGLGILLINNRMYKMAIGVLEEGLKTSLRQYF